MSDDLTAERRLGGAGMHMTPAERRAVAVSYLTDPDLGTISACAKHFNRTREAVAACLKGEEFEALRRQIDQEAGDVAKRILKSGRERAARAWVEQAIATAAEKGDHKPARDLLVATKVIEPSPHTSSMFIAVQVANQPVRWQESGTGVEYEELPDDAIGVQIGARLDDVKLGV